MRKPNYIDLTEKRCGGCHSVKPIADFHLIRTGRTERQSYCKTCHREYDKRHRPPKPRLVVAAGYKQCRCCYSVKLVADFSAHPYTRDLCQSYCKECMRVKCAGYYHRRVHGDARQALANEALVNESDSAEALAAQWMALCG